MKKKIQGKEVFYIATDIDGLNFTFKTKSYAVFALKIKNPDQKVTIDLQLFAR